MFITREHTFYTGLLWTIYFEIMLESTQFLVKYSIHGYLRLIFLTNSYIFSSIKLLQR